LKQFLVNKSAFEAIMTEIRIHFFTLYQCMTDRQTQLDFYANTALHTTSWVAAFRKSVKSLFDAVLTETRWLTAYFLGHRVYAEYDRAVREDKESGERR